MEYLGSQEKNFALTKFYVSCCYTAKIVRCKTTKKIFIQKLSIRFQSNYLFFRFDEPFHKMSKLLFFLFPSHVFTYRSGSHFSVGGPTMLIKIRSAAFYVVITGLLSVMILFIALKLR